MTDKIDPKNRDALKTALAQLDYDEAERAKAVEPLAHLPRWKIIEKREVSQPSANRYGGPTIPGAKLVLVCEREGRRREAIVSNHTWNTTKVGDEIGLTDPA
jgi:hypothetical protein